MRRLFLAALGAALCGAAPRAVAQGVAIVGATVVDGAATPIPDAVGSSRATGSSRSVRARAWACPRA